MAGLMQEVLVHVGVLLFQKKLQLGNDALKGLQISEFHAHALAELGNFFVYAKTQATPGMSDDRVISAMADIGWFSERGVNLLTMSDLEPLIKHP